MEHIFLLLAYKVKKFLEHSFEFHQMPDFQYITSIFNLKSKTKIGFHNIHVNISEIWCEIDDRHVRLIQVLTANIKTEIR